MWVFGMNLIEGEIIKIIKSFDFVGIGVKWVIFEEFFLIY